MAIHLFNVTDIAEDLQRPSEGSYYGGVETTHLIDSVYSTLRSIVKLDLFGLDATILNNTILLTSHSGENIDHFHKLHVGQEEQCIRLLVLLGLDSCSLSSSASESRSESYSASGYSQDEPPESEEYFTSSRSLVAEDSPSDSSVAVS